MEGVGEVLEDDGGVVGTGLGEVPSRPDERLDRVLGRVDRRVRDLGRHRQRDRSTAGAEVDADGRGIGTARSASIANCTDRLGLGARDEDAWSDREFHRTERCTTRDVLQRFARGPTLDQLSEHGALFGVEHATGDRRGLHGTTTEAEHVSEEEVRVDVG